MRDREQESDLTSVSERVRESQRQREREAGIYAKTYNVRTAQQRGRLHKFNKILSEDYAEVTRKKAQSAGHLTRCLNQFPITGSNRLLQTEATVPCPL